jgi:hypothetical protein
MPIFHLARASEPRLRVVFKGDQVSFGFAAGATFAEVAEWVAGVSRFHDSAPVAIDVTMPMFPDSSTASKGVSDGAH